MLWKTALSLSLWLILALLLRRGLRGSGLPPLAAAVAVIGLALTGFAGWQIGQTGLAPIRSILPGRDGTFHETAWFVVPNSPFLLPGLLCLAIAGLGFIASSGRTSLRWLTQPALSLAYAGAGLILTAHFSFLMQMPQVYIDYATFFLWANTLTHWAYWFLTIGLALLLILALTALIQTLSRKS